MVLSPTVNFRNEYLNQHWFRTLEEPKYEIEKWR